ncbi:MAG TPA: hypothetical protein VIE65_12945 [Methylobacter sp.]|jgi:hypothetical protein
MNKNRRKTISEIADRITGLKTDIEIVRDEEQEAYDALPESLQGGDKGQAMQSAIDALENAINSLDEVESSLEEAGN